MSTDTTPRAKITVQAVVDAPVELVWKIWTDPEHIVQWNAASDDWHTTKSTNDLTLGGRFSSTMAAKDGSATFDFGGVYTTIEPLVKIAYTLDDNRTVEIQFLPHDNQTKVIETFETESTHTIDQQRMGWQAILDNFKHHTERQELP